MLSKSSSMTLRLPTLRIRALADVIPFLVILAVAAIASLTTLKLNLLLGDDSLSRTVRLTEFSRELQSGHLILRWAPDVNYGPVWPKQMPTSVAKAPATLVAGKTSIKGV